jgi:hypothetical protein
LVENHLGENWGGVYAELWTSLASLLRSYTAAHGLHTGTAAEVAWDATHILAQYKDKWLDLKREGARVAWMRENGNGGLLELTEHGQLRGADCENEMDTAAEAWARELMA